jgi:hypothetical protein
LQGRANADGFIGEFHVHEFGVGGGMYGDGFDL